MGIIIPANAKLIPVQGRFNLSTYSFQNTQNNMKKLFVFASLLLTVTTVSFAQNSDSTKTKKAVAATKSTAKKVGAEIKKDAKFVGNGVKKGAVKVGEGAEKAYQGSKKVANKVGTGVKEEAKKL